jgi:hypothetical protein
VASSPAAPPAFLSTRSLVPVLLAIAAVTLLTFRGAGAVTIGIDPSWHVANHLAVVQQLAFGREFVWTYGPLGFLLHPYPYVGFTSSLGIVYDGLVYAGIAALLVISARRAMPLWAAALVALIAGRIFIVVPPPEAQIGLVALVAVEVLAGRVRLAPMVIVVIAGVAAGITGLGKLNAGMFVALAGAIVTIGVAPDRWRGLAGYALSAASGGLLIWLLAGQAIADLPAYVTSSFEMVSGYSEAMGRDATASLQWAYLAFGLATAVFAWLCVTTTSDWPRRSRVALGSLAVVLLFMLWKISFTRTFPAYAFVIPMAVAFPLVFRSRPNARRTWPALAVLLMASLAATQMAPQTFLNVRGSVTTAVQTARDLFVPGRASARADRTRADLRELLALKPPVLDAIRGRTLHIDPWQTTVAFAYPETIWRPLPVFQSYQAYTSSLDELNAASLRSPTAPDRILRERVEVRTADGGTIEQTVDGRSRWFEMPRSTLEMMCRYDEVVADERWQVLALSSHRCGMAVLVSSETVSAGSTVRVPTPRPGEFLVVRVLGLNDDLLSRIRTFLWRSQEWYIRQDDGPSRRLVPGTADDGLLLAVPDSVVMHANFAFGPPVKAIRVEAGKDGTASSASLTYEFWSVPRVGG